MRFSIRTPIAAVAASIALAACGGHGLVPSQSGAPVSSFGELTKKPTTCPTSKVQPAWIFKGSCVVTKLPAKGTTIKLPAYMGITLTASIPANDGKDAAFALVDAVGGKAKDIEKWKGLAFPAAPNKSVIYAQAINGFNDLKFTNAKQYLVFEVSSTKAFPGKACPLQVLGKRAKGFAWTTTALQGAIKGKTMTFTIPTTELPTLFPDGLPKGPLFLNAACT
jgi:hypothetical protein